MKRPLVLFLFGFIGFTLMSFFAENASASLGLMIFLLAARGESLPVSDQ
jgi:hypothetical protein